MNKRQQLILSHQNFVLIIARDVKQRLPKFIDQDDLVGVGMLGLIRAADRYDSGSEVPFHQYAKHRIRGSMLDYLRQSGCGGRKFRAEDGRFQAAKECLLQKLQRAPDDSEMASALNMPLDAYQELAGALHCAVSPVLSLDSPQDMQDHEVPRTHSVFGEPTPFQQCESEQLRSVLQKAIRQLPDRWQTIITLYHFADMTMKQIGALYGCKESRISQIHSECLRRLRTILKERGHTAETIFVKGAAA